MNISIIGTGYVGLITGVCFADLGNQVTCVDVVKEKVEKINRGEAPLYEDGLREVLKRNLKRLKATTDLRSAVLESDITFICVGTPDKKGGIDLSYIKLASEGIGNALREKKGYHVVVDKSTVVPGTTDSVIIPILEQTSGKRAGKDFGVAMNPEFLREGSAIRDFMEPDRIVIGGLDERSIKAVADIYSEFDCPVLKTDLRTAEMIKYAANAFLATKISFINEIANICERVGTDVVDVARGIGMDKRISPHFLNAGAGYGGSCFPKDVKAIVELGRKKGYKPTLLEAVMDVNRGQALHILEILKKKMGKIKGRRIGVIGLAFKPGTDDMRESPAITIIEGLLKEGAEVSACDPIAIDNARRIFGNRILLSRGLEECLKGCDGAVIVTGWPEYRVGADVYARSMKGKVLIDGRRIIDPAKAERAGLDYFGIGWGRNMVGDR